MNLSQNSHFNLNLNKSVKKMVHIL
jgi:hypothetical protein